MSVPRFYVPAASASGAVVALPEDEATHLTRVLRLMPGAIVHVFDGRGQEWQAEVCEIGKRRVTVRQGDVVVPAPESRIAITLVLAVLKSDKMDDVVRDAVMLGVTTITPLLTERTEITASLIERSQRLARWQRIAVSSTKQCGRAVVPMVTAAASLEGVLAASPPMRIMLMEPGASGDCAIALREVPPASAVHVLVGPEGGWTGREVQLAAATGAMLVTLGGQTLRADAVPLVAITALRVLWKDL